MARKKKKGAAAAAAPPKAPLKAAAAADEYHSSGEEDYDDSDFEGHSGYRRGGYHPVCIGQMYNGRFLVLRKLGWGHFSTCWLCLDRRTGQRVAMKVQKSAPHYTEAAIDEIKLLEAAYSEDPHSPVVRLVDHFTHVGPNGTHVCMVFEALGPNLLSLIKQYNYKGIPLPIVRHLAKQILLGLHHLHTKCNIIHTDLKPENVLLCRSLPDTSSGDSPMRGMQSSVKRERPSNKRAPLSRSKEKKLRQRLKKRLKKKQARLQQVKGDPKQRRELESQISELLEELNVSLNILEQKQRETGSASGSKGARSDSNHAGAAAEAAAAASSSAAGDDAAVSVEDGDAVAQALAATEAQPDKPINEMSLDEFLHLFDCKLVDLGNACWTFHHFTDQVQTRQYRAPEVILGYDYDAVVDMWSFGTFIFELATGDMLFDPHSGDNYERDEDHLAQIMELVGPFDVEFATGGRLSAELFDSDGSLLHIRELQFWDIEHVLVEKYGFGEADAVELGDFLRPLLQANPAERATAEEMLQHPWLDPLLMHAEHLSDVERGLGGADDDEENDGGVDVDGDDGDDDDADADDADGEFGGRLGAFEGARAYAPLSDDAEFADIGAGSDGDVGALVGDGSDADDDSAGGSGAVAGRRALEGFALDAAAPSRAPRGPRARLRAAMVANEQAAGLRNQLSADALTSGPLCPQPSELWNCPSDAEDEADPSDV